MSRINSKTIVFIHGAFVSYQCWDEWIKFFGSKGYKCIAPPWPFKDADAKTQRSLHPDSEAASLRLTPLIDHYIKIIKKLPEKPILIGHSLGGLITQILLNRGYAAAGIAIHTVPPHGIMPTQFSFFRTTWRALGLFTSAKKTYLMSFKKWQYAFTNGMPLDEQTNGYEKLAVPESKLLLRDGLTSAADVDMKNTPAPLLFTSGSTDHCVPAALNLKLYKKYKTSDTSNALIEYKEFEGHNHSILTQPAWKEDAEYILNWIDKYSVKDNIHHPSENNVLKVAENLR